jgi:predicted CopG family antitoxin
VSFKTIKIKDETYESLNIFVGELRKELKKPVSIDEAVRRLLNIRKKLPSQYAGAWKMDEKEVKEIKQKLSESWKKWEL